MERLTERERNVDGTGVAKEEITDGLLKPFADKILTKLAVYEDLEEQGLLARLPCKVGTEVFCYFPGDGHYTKCQIKKNRNLSKHIWKYMLLCRASCTKGTLLQIF